MPTTCPSQVLRASLAPQEQIIAAITERLDDNLADAHKVWVQHAFEYAAEQPHVRRAAQANTQENLDKEFEGMVLDRHNADLITRVFKDHRTTEFFTALARRFVYKMVRAAGAAG